MSPDAMSGAEQSTMLHIVVYTICEQGTHSTQVR